MSQADTGGGPPRASVEVWTTIDDCSEAVTPGFGETAAAQSRRDTQLRTAVLDGLMDGSLGDGPRLWDAATSLNLPQQGAFVVVAAESPQAGDQSLLRLKETLRRREVISASRFDTQQQTGIVSLSRLFTVDILCQQIALVAPGRLGVSALYGSLPMTPAALREARVACSSAGYQARAVVRYDKEPVAVLLASCPEASAVLASSTLGPVLALQRADRALLLDTLRSWLAGHGSAATAAAQLHVHRNTVRYRLRRIEALTESDLSDPIAVGRLHLALESTRIFGVDRVASAGAQTVEPSVIG